MHQVFAVWRQLLPLRRSAFVYQFALIRYATRKNAGANMLKGCRRTVPAEGFAFHSTHLAEGRHRWRVAVVGRSGSQLCRLPLPNANRSLRICFGVLLMKVIFQSRTRSAIKRGTARPGERHRLRGLRGKLPRGARIARRNVDSAAEAKATVINDADAAAGPGRGDHHDHVHSFSVSEVLYHPTMQRFPSRLCLHDLPGDNGSLPQDRRRDTISDTRDRKPHALAE